jgi:quinol monooxygenase YgiN
VGVTPSTKKEISMLEQVVRLTVELAVKEGQWEEFKSLAETMTTISKTEPRTLGYEWFSSGDQKRFRLVETYSDSDAVLAHFMGPAVQEFVPKLMGTCTVTGFEVYGDPGQKVAEMVAGFGAETFEYWMGINR